ncbi:hypothetical protein COU61_00040 [Candidatus Pacearchaeota archaeon CG10_big_fil_rev_8_21_14_0_10_35_13]|nr:MAG: hypothetical protein COU61_00040 [Candidatus Pacearchaeota archaeon CG10_big_fil_rev_8_21_14_0_10_35_13]
MTSEINFSKLSAFVIIAVLFISAVFIIRPIILAVIFGLLLAYVFFPLYKKVYSVVKEKNTSSLVIIALVFLIIFLPLWFLLPIMFKQIFEVYLYTQKVNMVSFVRDIFPQDTLSDAFYSNFSSVISGFVTKLASFVSTSFSNSLLNIPNFLLQMLIVLFTMFYSMRDSSKLRAYVTSISPFSKSAEDRLLVDFKSITNSVIYGSFFVGLILGAVMGIGFFVFNVPNALLLTILAAFAGIIPVIGVWTVWIPVVAFLLATGHVSSGIGLAVYSLLTTFFLESLIRSYFVSKGGKMHSVIALIGMLGGLYVFGFLGLLLGPLILAYVLMILEAYKKKELSSLFS